MLDEGEEAQAGVIQSLASQNNSNNVYDWRNELSEEDRAAIAELEGQEEDFNFF